MTIYCVYQTTYSGDKLPPFYIGSSSVDKLNEGYRGSVSSKAYKDIWIHELKNNPHLFSTEVLSTHTTRQEAFDEELRLQIELNVVTNPNYINLSLAQPNGFFGVDISGDKNPMFGKVRTDSSERMKSNNPMFDPEVVRKVSNSKRGQEPWNKGIENPDQKKRWIEDNPMKNPETVKRMLEKRTPESVGKGKIWIANTTTKQRDRVHPDLFEELSKSGWIRLSNKKPIPD